MGQIMLAHIDGVPEAVPYMVRCLDYGKAYGGDPRLEKMQTIMKAFTFGTGVAAEDMLSVQQYGCKSMQKICYAYEIGMEIAVKDMMCFAASAEKMRVILLAHLNGMEKIISQISRESSHVDDEEYLHDAIKCRAIHEMKR